MKLKIARKILLFAARGFGAPGSKGMTTGQRRRERHVRWREKTIRRAYDRMGPGWSKLWHRGRENG